MPFNEMPGPSNWQYSHRENYLPYGAQFQRGLQEVKSRPPIVPLPYPTTPEPSRPHSMLPPPPQYVEATPASSPQSPVVDSYRFGNPEHSKLFRKAREEWRSIWDRAEWGSLLREDEQGGISAGYGGEGPPEGTVKPVFNISFSRKSDQDASSALLNRLPASIAGYPNRKPVMFKASRKPQISLLVRETLLVYLQKTIDEALQAPKAVPQLLKVCSSVEICHPKPQAFPIPRLDANGRFDPRFFVGSRYLNCTGVVTISNWLHNDEAVNEWFDAFEGSGNT